MDTRRYLGQISWYEKRIMNKLEEIQRLRDMIGLCGLNYDKEDIQTTKVYDRMGDAIAKITDLETETMDIVDLYSKSYKLIVRQIDSMDGLDYEILENKYIKSKSVTQIADEMGYTREYVSRSLTSAIRNFEKIYGESYLEKENCHIMSRNVT